MSVATTDQSGEPAPQSGILQIPEALEPPDVVPPYGPILRNRILSAFRGSIEQIGTPFAYRLGVVFVALALVLLPLAYLLLIGLYLKGYATLLVLGKQVLMEGSSRVPLLFGLLCLAGPFGLFLMIKPIFARRPADAERVSVTREDEPLLFAFVDHICELVHAPRPSRIDLTVEVNAAAGFNGGLMSLLRRRMVLTLGTPLISGLTTEQLAGVLAHEFGHFSQGSAMRFTYVVDWVNRWFYRVVFERDMWDYRLYFAARSNNLFTRFGAQLAQAFIWLVRKILAVLMAVGRALSSYLSRQMEFQADKFQTRLIGPDVFETTFLEVHCLGAAFELSLDDLDETWQDGRLCESFAALIEANRQRLGDDIQAQAEEFMYGRTTNWFDTHPAPKHRIEQSRVEGQRPGFAPKFRCEDPARVLFRDFEELSRTVSLNYYEAVLGTRPQPQQLLTIEELKAQTLMAADARIAQNRYFQGCLNEVRPVQLRNPLPQINGTAGLIDSQETLANYRQKLKELAQSYDRSLRLLWNGERKLTAALQAQAMLGCGLKVNPSEYDLPSGTAKAIRSQIDRARARSARLSQVLDETEQLLEQRLALGLALSQVPEIERVHPEIRAVKERVERLLPAANVLGEAMSELTGVRRRYYVVSQLLFATEQFPDQNPVRDAASRELLALQRELTQIYAGLRNAAYPFDHARGELTLAEYVLPTSPHEIALGDIADVAVHMLELVRELYYRVLSEPGGSRGVARARPRPGPLGRAPSSATHSTNLRNHPSKRANLSRLPFESARLERHASDREASSRTSLGSPRQARCSRGSEALLT